MYATSSASSQIHFIQNEISSTLSDSDIFLAGNGTGFVRFKDLTLDSTVRINDNKIRTVTSNANLVLTANGTGKVQIDNVDIDSGTIDGTPIGATTPASATFTTLAYNDSSIAIDGVTINDNTIKTNSSNANLEFGANGSGYVKVNDIKFPNSGGTAGQVLQTDGSGTLSWVTSPILFDSTLISDGTDTITGNSTAQTFDTFSASTYRSAKYTIQISDATANRFALIEANVTHDGSNAYISTYGGADNGTGDGSTVYDPLEFTAIISSGDVRVRAKVNNTNSHVLKFVRRAIKV